MKTIKTTLLKRSTINLAVVALLSVLAACATTASPNAATQNASPGPTAARENIRNDLGTQNYLRNQNYQGAFHGSGM